MGTGNMAFLRNMPADKLSSLIPSMLSASWNKTNELMQKTVHITLTTTVSSAKGSKNKGMCSQQYCLST